MKFKNLAFLILVIVLNPACKSELPVIDDLSNQNFQMINQDSMSVSFPSSLRGKLSVIGYIFTNCPDICPLTTNNMYLIEKSLDEDELKNVKFVSISFDPDHDKPPVLKKYSEIRNLNPESWIFLTGEKKVVDSLMKTVGVLAMPADTSRTPSGKEIVLYVHTDRISLMDENGRIRKNYKGSEINIEEINSDLKALLNNLER